MAGLLDLLKPQQVGGLLGSADNRTLLGLQMLANSGPSLTPRSGFEGIPELAAGMQQRQQQQRLMEDEKQRQSQLSSALVNAMPGLNPQLAQADPDMALKVFQAQKNSANRPNYGLNPIYGTDASGKTVLGQIGSDGSFVQTQMPEGFQVSSGIEKIDGGTKWLLYDKRSGQLVGEQPKDIAGAAQAEVIGKAQGEKIAGAEQAAQQARLVLNNIKAVRDHPGREWATGAWSMNPLRAVPGTDEYNFGVRLAQLQGQTFLEAFERLKGGGAITQVEGEKGTQAVARLNAAQSQEEFLAALKDFEDVVQAGLDRAEGRIPASQQSAPPAPSMSSSGGYRILSVEE